MYFITNSTFFVAPESIQPSSLCFEDFERGLGCGPDTGPTGEKGLK
jgi:hypothetical protein